MKFSELKWLYDIKNDYDFEFSNMGMAITKIPNTLSFLKDAKYCKNIVSNNNITAVITTTELAQEVSNLNFVIVDDPLKTFYEIYEIWASMKPKNHSIISSNANIHPRASISPYNVVIEENVLIEENVVIKDDVTIGKNSIIRANSILGNPGLEVKKIDNKNLCIQHNGFLKIGEDVEVQSGSCLDKGIYGESTIIGNYTKIGALCVIAHNSVIGENCIIAPKVVVSGSVKIGNRVWIGPSSTISSYVTIGDNARVTIGSAVMNYVPDNLTVTGYIAQEHNLFLLNYLSLFKRRRKVQCL
jgi:UDP-3-O-[3-hydroxymyristoyl] glucosamine N-acyltransferase